MTTSNRQPASEAASLSKAAGPAGGVPDSLLRDLRQRLIDREINKGIELLQRRMELIRQLRPEHSNAGAFVCTVAQWVDIGFDHPTLLKELISRFTPEERAALPLADYAQLRMAEGMLALSEEESDKAIRHLDFVIGMDNELHDKYLVAIATFWKGRSLRKKAGYDEALTCTVNAQRLATDLGYQKTAAVMQVLESWLLFQKGRDKEAATVLRQAEARLRETDDHLALGNIWSSRGRIARRECRHEQAIECFDKAIAEYRQTDPHHRNLARSLVNIAIVKRHIALQLRDKIDADARRKRGTGGTERRSNARGMQMRKRLEQLRTEAFADLEEAKEIYRENPNQHGSGSVRLTCGYLHLDNGDFDRAAEEADRSFHIAEQKTDYVLMSRARLLQCLVENGKLEEEVGEGGDPGSHARRALEAAREAVELAKHTQNRRVLAAAHIGQGLTESNSFFDDVEAAQRSYELAATALKDQDHGNLAPELKLLKSRLVRTGAVDPTLRAWTQGLVGSKSFQQMVDEFADIVVPRVWEREGRKISRVAERLSMSPKKVRRILKRAVRRGGRS